MLKCDMVFNSSNLVERKLKLRIEVVKPGKARAGCII